MPPRTRSLLRRGIADSALCLLCTPKAEVSASARQGRFMSTRPSIISAAPRCCTCCHQSVAEYLNAKVDGQGCRLPGRLYDRPGHLLVSRRLWRDRCLPTPVSARSMRGRDVLPSVCFWHKADMLKPLTNVRFWGQGGQSPTAGLPRIHRLVGASAPRAASLQDFRIRRSTRKKDFVVNFYLRWR